MGSPLGISTRGMTTASKSLASVATTAKRKPGNVDAAKNGYDCVCKWLFTDQQRWELDDETHVFPTKIIDELCRESKTYAKLKDLQGIMVPKSSNKLITCKSNQLDNATSQNNKKRRFNEIISS